MKNLKIALLTAILAAPVAGGAHASSCSATNEVGDRCSITCPPGQAASCANASGAGTPSCECR